MVCCFVFLIQLDTFCCRALLADTEEEKRTQVARYFWAESGDAVLAHNQPIYEDRGP